MRGSEGILEDTGGVLGRPDVGVKPSLVPREDFCLA